MTISVEELEQMRRGQVIVDDEGDGFEIVDIIHAERRFSARIPHREDSPFSGGMIVAYTWDAEGNIYYHGDKALQSEDTHLADAIFTLHEAHAICSYRLKENIWLGAEHIELQDGVLHPYAGGDILPLPSIEIRAMILKEPGSRPGNTRSTR